MAQIIEEKPVAKKAPAKKAAPKKAAHDEFIAALEKARKAGVVIKASIAWTDKDGNVHERSF